MLKKLLPFNKTTVQTNLYEFRERLGLHDYLRPDEKAHTRVLTALMRFKQQIIEYKGRGQSYYIDPDQKVMKKTNIPGDVPKPIRSSANISYTEDKLENGQWSFAMTIDKSSDTYFDMRNRMIFGLYGLFDRQSGEMAVTTILAPDMDGDGNLLGMIQIPLSESDLELATLYAENCAREIFEGRSPDPQRCLTQAIQNNMQQPEELQKPLP